MRSCLNVPGGDGGSEDEQSPRTQPPTHAPLPRAQAGSQGEGDVRGRKGPRLEEETHVGKEGGPPPL